MFVKINNKIIDLKPITKEEPLIENSKLFRLIFHSIFYSFKDEKYGSSGRSYLIPIPTAIKGLLMTMLGLKRKDQNYFFNNYKIMVGSCLDFKKIKKINTGINLFKEVGNFTKIQVNKEIIYYNGEVEIYVLVDKENEDLIKAIENKEFIFIPYFGSSSFLVELKNVEEIKSFQLVNINKEELIKKEFLVEYVTTKKDTNSNILEKDYIYLFDCLDRT